MLNPASRTILVLFAIASGSGCIALALGAVGGAAGVTYVKGNLTDKLDHSAGAVRAAAVMALEEMALPIYENEVDLSSARLRSEFADDKDVWITIKSITAGSSKITIRVGITGHQRRSVRILDTIKANL